MLQVGVPGSGLTSSIVLAAQCPPPSSFSPVRLTIHHSASSDGLVTATTFFFSLPVCGWGWVEAGRCQGPGHRWVVA